MAGENGKDLAHTAWGKQNQSGFQEGFPFFSFRFSCFIVCLLVSLLYFNNPEQTTQDPVRHVDATTQDGPPFPGLIVPGLHRSPLAGRAKTEHTKHAERAHLELAKNCSHSPPQ